MRSITITCDQCDRDLTESHGSKAYRICVSSELIPNTSGVSYDMHIAPPIKQALHFCGTGCLSNYCATRL